MSRARLAVAITAISGLLLGPVGATGAEVFPSPSPTVTASATAPVPTQAASPTSDPTAVRDEPVNQPPVAVDDPDVRVVAGRSVTLRVLANDTDDGLGRPPGTPPHLEIATFTPRGDRVTKGPGGTVLRFTARAADARHRLAVSYTATDGELTSGSAVVVVAVDPPPARRRVSLSAPTGMLALHAYRLSGRVTPHLPATVSVERRAGSAWRRIRSERVGPRGGFAVRFSTDRAQRYTFRAVASWPNGTRSTSRRVARRVLARSEARVSGPLTRRAVPYSYRPGCPVRPGQLRRITVNHWTYRNAVARGSLVVRAGAVPDRLRVLRASFGARFPMRSIRPSDAFYAGGRRSPTGSDVAAMRADNTSAFNCRPVTGNPYRVSQHSYGDAVDINTVRNPYVVGSRVYPSWARTYLDRSNVRTGMILPGGVVARTMRANGWPWGARWSHPDYQHFSANGG